MPLPKYDLTVVISVIFIIFGGILTLQGIYFAVTAFTLYTVFELVYFGSSTMLLIYYTYLYSSMKIEIDK